MILNSVWNNLLNRIKVFTCVNNYETRSSWLGNTEVKNFWLPFDLSISLKNCRGWRM